MGETWQRIYSLSTWREVGFYSERERASAAWTKTLTRLANKYGHHDTAFDTLKAQFTGQEIVEIIWAFATVNIRNCMAVGMRQPFADKALV